jgi:hypothetical protein
MLHKGRLLQILKYRALMTVTNIITYYSNQLITIVKSFIVKAPFLFNKLKSSRVSIKGLASSVFSTSAFPIQSDTISCTNNALKKIKVLGNHSEELDCQDVIQSLHISRQYLTIQTVP